MRQGKVFHGKDFAGTITETEDRFYIFQYDYMYVVNHPDRFITFTMPVRIKPYKSNRLFSFFEGLLPEGWLLDQASTYWNIDRYDSMGLLLKCCRDCIGAVSVEEVVIFKKDLGL